MDPRDERDRGWMWFVVGLGVVVLSVLVFGLTTESGALDWVSIVTAAAGVLMAITGLYVAIRSKGTGARPTGTKPHPAS